jgi:hypothetical protein
MAWTRTGRRLEALEKRLEEMEDAHERVTMLEVDCSDLIEKGKNVLARLAQRARAEAAAEDQLELPRTPGPNHRGINPMAAKLLGLTRDGG